MNQFIFNILFLTCCWTHRTWHFVRKDPSRHILLPLLLSLGILLLKFYSSLNRVDSIFKTKWHWHNKMLLLSTAWFWSKIQRELLCCLTTILNSIYCVSSQKMFLWPKYDHRSDDQNNNNNNLSENQNESLFSMLEVLINENIKSDLKNVIISSFQHSMSLWYYCKYVKNHHMRWVLSHEKHTLMDLHTCDLKIPCSYGVIQH